MGEKKWGALDVLVESGKWKFTKKGGHGKGDCSRRNSPDFAQRCFQSYMSNLEPLTWKLFSKYAEQVKEEDLEDSVSAPGFT